VVERERGRSEEDEDKRSDPDPVVAFFAEQHQRENRYKELLVYHLSKQEVDKHDG